MTENFRQSGICIQELRRNAQVLARVLIAAYKIRDRQLAVWREVFVTVAAQSFAATGLTIIGTSWK